ncbi:MAG: serine hydrolase domain-containing protein [Bryobacteraceae bacterium]
MTRLTPLLLVAILCPAAPPGSKAGFDSERLARIPVRMQAFVDRGDAAGVVNLVARHGKIGLLEARGLQDMASKKPMRTDTIFQVMSMTKPFTGVAIMMLMEEGRLSLYDAVEKHLPEFRGQMLAVKSAGGSQQLQKPSRAITIRDLMTHTGGMSGPHEPIAALYSKLDLSLANAVKTFAKSPLDFEPGSKWAYSNTGIATLGRIIEVASNQPYEKFVGDRIFEPLGMKDSFFFPPPDKVSRIAGLYSRKDNQFVTAEATSLGGDWSKYRKSAKYPAPEFGLFSTATDLFHFYQMMLNGGSFEGKRLLSQPSVEAMTAVQTGDLKAGHNPGSAFGLTWEVFRDPVGMLTLLSPGTFGHEARSAPMAG